MPEISTDKRDQARTLIRLYCNRPFCNHGKKRSNGPYKGWHLHDWGHVVQRVYRIFYDLPLDIPSATVAASHKSSTAFSRIGPNRMLPIAKPLAMKAMSIQIFMVSLWRPRTSGTAGRCSALR